jgi:Mg-chelatase subunit ChlD
MHSVMESDKKTIDDGHLIQEALNQGVGSFTPELMFENIVKNYKNAKRLFGETILRQISGYSADYIEKNKKIPEFQKQLKKNIEQKVKQLKEDGLLTKYATLTEQGIDVAALVMCMEELDHLTPQGIKGERLHKKASHYGERGDVRNFKKGDRYKDIALKKSLKTALRRMHDHLYVQDLKVFERQSKGTCHIVYGLDASASMRGGKLGQCKKAGVALAYKAIMNKDKVGLLVFGDEVKESIAPTLDFKRVLHGVLQARASSQTDLSSCVKKSLELFPTDGETKHLILLTDALPTAGNFPEKKTIQALSIAKNQGITTSLIGISLDEKGKELAQKMVDIGGGKLYLVKDLADVDKLVLEEYYRIA